MADAFMPDRRAKSLLGKDGEGCVEHAIVNIRIARSAPREARPSRLLRHEMGGLCRGRGGPSRLHAPMIYGRLPPVYLRRTVRAAVLREGTIEARDTEDPVPGPGQLLVRSLACGICASDIHFMDHPEGDTEDDSGLSNYDPNADI